MKTTKTNGVTIMSWCEDPEKGAMDQMINVAMHPRVYNHVAMMPDAHQGYGMPIGGVCGLLDAVSPNMVGKDIACGMRVVKLGLNCLPGHAMAIYKNRLEKTKALIEERVPTGFSTNNNTQDHVFEIDECFEELRYYSDIFSRGYKKKVEKSIGTLGGGNHFIEIQQDDDGNFYAMIHSGSRNFGSQIADLFDGIAQNYNQMFSTVGLDRTNELAFLPRGIKEFEQYISCMDWAMKYAKENRRVMMTHVVESIRECFGYCTVENEYDIHHNYAALENHLGTNVWVHRKGATSAKAGQAGIIPGSQGSYSYLVEGLGNPLSFMSCSHGAGRSKSRTKATLELNMKEQELLMKNIIHSKPGIIKRGGKKIRGMHDLGECPGAYKDIDEVMKNQSDLVKIKTRLTPVMSIKG